MFKIKNTWLVGRTIVLFSTRRLRENRLGNEERELRLVAPVQGGLCHKALAVLYVPIQVGPVY